MYVWLTLVFIGVALMVAIVVKHRDGSPHEALWPLWLALGVVSLIIGAVWPTGAS